MLPALVLKHIAAPGAFEAQFLKYLDDAGFETDKVAKTIAGTAYYHYKTIAAVTNQEFFAGQVDQLATNMPTNNFVRPEGEHQMIYGVRVEEATNADQTLLDWLPGVQSAQTKNSVMSITVNNIVKLKDYPLTEALADLTDREIGYIPLQEPIVWGGQETMSLVWRNKNGGVGAANQYLKFTLCAIGLI